MPFHLLSLTGSAIKFKDSGRQAIKGWNSYQDHQSPHPMFSFSRAASHSKNMVQLVSDLIGLPTGTKNYVIGVIAN